MKLFEQDGCYGVELAIPCNHVYMLEILPVNDFADTYDGFDAAEFFGLV